MKTFFLISIISIFFFSVTDAQNHDAVLNITVTDMQKVPSEGDKLLFIGQKSEKTYETISGEGGKCSIKVPSNDTYQIKVASFDGESNYMAVNIVGADYLQEFELEIQFELPKTYTLKNVNFATGSAKLKPSSFESLNNLAEFMTYKKSLKIELAGHTDNVGDENTNLNLSQKRAESVKSYLIKKGITPTRLVAKGYGETVPIADNNTDEGKQTNRRTEIRILEQ